MLIQLPELDCDYISNGNSLKLGMVFARKEKQRLIVMAFAIYMHNHLIRISIQVNNLSIKSILFQMKLFLSILLTNFVHK